MVNQLLSAAGVWKTVGSVAVAILILLVMITVHEFGHYLAGKIFRFKINEFSIGFGPAIFKRKNRKTGELFSVRVIPLGGYCAFEGEDGLDEEDETGSDEKRASDEPSQDRAHCSDGAENEPSQDRAHCSDGAENEPSQVRALSSTDGAENVCDDPKVGDGTKSRTTADSFTKKPCWQRIVVLISGALMNYLLALLLIVVNFLSFGQTMIAVYRAEPTDTIPAEYCLRDRDILLEANGRSLYLTTDLIHALRGGKAGDLVEFTLSRVAGQTESGETVREETTVRIMLRADVEAENSTETDGVWKALGFAYEEEGDYPGYQVASSSYRFGFFETVGRSFAYSFRLAGAIFRILGELLTGALGLSALGGPVTTITMTSKIVSRGVRSMLEIAGYIGVNLAVFNLLPIPALDGSKVVFTLIEWVRGKPVNRKVEAVIHTVGFLFLFGFALLVDLLQLF
ncbi:MAG: M50 family metallopeptidase [Candidatus Gallimonas sp.]